MTTHSAEPWGRSNTASALLNASGIIIGQIYVYKSPPIPEYYGQVIPIPEGEANIERIIACVNACEGLNPEAVPEMYEILQDFIMWVNDDHESVVDGIVVKAKAAIAKAEGK